MKFKFLFACLLAGASLASAQGFSDGVQYYRVNQYDDAETIINRVINDPATDKSMADFYLGQIAFNRGDVAKARSLFNQGISADANNPYNYVGLGRAELKAGNKAAASEQFKLAKKLAKKDDALLVEIARAYYETDPVAYQKDIQGLLKEANKANKQGSAAIIFEAECFADQGNINESARYFDLAKATLQSTNKAAEHPEAFVNYARIIFKVNPQNAIQQLNELIEIAPNSALAQRELAEKYYDCNQLIRAADEYGKYMNNPNHFQRDEQRYVSLLYFGEKYDLSNEWADKILAKDPDNFYMKRMKLYNYAALNDAENATKAADEFFAIPNGPFNSHDYTVYGEFLTDLGNDSLAIVQYEKAVEIDPGKNSLNADLSAAYSGAKMYAKAAEAYQKYIDNGEHPVNDYMTLARRYQNATAQTPIGSPERSQYAAKAVEALNYVDAKAPENISVYFAKAQISLLDNDNKVNDNVVAEINNLLNLLQAKGADAKEYKTEYQFAYTMLGQKALTDKNFNDAYTYFSKLLELDPSNAAVAGAVEEIKKML